MEVYGFSFTIFELIALGILLLSFCYQLYFYLRYINGVLRLRNKINNGEISFQNEQAPVSVIICAKDEYENLKKFLPMVLEQDYPEFEVIVINDGSTDETETLLRDLKMDNPRLRTTFVPAGANNISTKKLGLTLGIKAAKYDILLFTDADCMPENKNWIARMARNFTRETDIVLGFGPYFRQNSFLNRLISYDTLFNGLQYLGMAIECKPYMGVGRNLAYRKEMFYAQKGFASTLGLSSGDDDLMVNKASTPWNTKVEIAPDSITWSEPNISFRGWRYQKERHLSVASYYKSESKMKLFFEPFTRGWFYLAFLLSVTLGAISWHWITIGVAILLFLIRFVVQLSIINRSAKHFGVRTFIFTIPLFDIYLPLINLHYFLFERNRKKTSWK